MIHPERHLALLRARRNNFSMIFDFSLFWSLFDFSGLLDFLFFWSLVDFSGLFDFSRLSGFLVTFRLFGTFRDFSGLFDFSFFWSLFDFSELYDFSGLFDFSPFFWSFSDCARAQPLAITEAWRCCRCSPATGAAFGVLVQHCVELGVNHLISTFFHIASALHRWNPWVALPSTTWKGLKMPMQGMHSTRCGPRAAHMGTSLPAHLPCASMERGCMKRARFMLVWPSAEFLLQGSSSLPQLLGIPL